MMACYLFVVSRASYQPLSLFSQPDSCCELKKTKQTNRLIAASLVKQLQPESVPRASSSVSVSRVSAGSRLKGCSAGCWPLDGSIVLGVTQQA